MQYEVFPTYEGKTRCAHDSCVFFRFLLSLTKSQCHNETCFGKLKKYVKKSFIIHADLLSGFRAKSIKQKHRQHENGHKVK